MKMNIKGAAVFIFYLFMLMYVFFSCKRMQGTEDDFATSLNLVFNQLSITKNGLDFPNEEELKFWKRNNSFSTSYLKVQEAKKELLVNIASSPDKTLSFTLDTICRECSHPARELGNMGDAVTEIDIVNRCYGSLSALYFFNMPDQDKVIMDRLLNASPFVLDWITHCRFEWQYNRPDPQAWIDALEEIPDDRVDKDITDSIIDNIKEAIHDPNPKKFGIMLE